MSMSDVEEAYYRQHPQFAPASFQVQLDLERQAALKAEAIAAITAEQDAQLARLPEEHRRAVLMGRMTPERQAEYGRLRVAERVESAQSEFTKRWNPTVRAVVARQQAEMAEENAAALVAQIDASRTTRAQRMAQMEAAADGPDAA